MGCPGARRPTPADETPWLRPPSNDPSRRLPGPPPRRSLIARLLRGASIRCQNHSTPSSRLSWIRCCVVWIRKSVCRLPRSCAGSVKRNKNRFDGRVPRLARCHPSSCHHLPSSSVALGVKRRPNFGIGQRRDRIQGTATYETVALGGAWQPHCLLGAGLGRDAVLREGSAFHSLSPAIRLPHSATGRYDRAVTGDLVLVLNVRSLSHDLHTTIVGHRANPCGR